MAEKEQAIRKVVTLYLKEFKKRKMDIDNIILFGSYANGRPRKHSDIDLAIISSSFRKKNIYDRLLMLAGARINIKIPLEVLGYTPEEYKNAEPTSFLGEIKRTGKIVYKKSRAHSSVG